MSTVTEQRLLSAEDFAALPREGLRLELVRGEIVAMPPAFGGHGKASMRLGGALGQHVMANDLGEVYAAETGFLVARNPDTVCAPDVAFIQKNRLPPPEADNSWVPVIPDLVAEVVSSGDRPKDVGEKVAMWLEAGVRMVVVLHDGELLEGADVVPGFAVPVARIFG